MALALVDVIKADGKPLPRQKPDRTLVQTENDPDAPTFEYLVSLRTQVESDFATQDNQIRRTRSVREMTLPVTMPKRYQLVNVEVRDPTVADECQRVTATLSINPPKLMVTPERESDAGQENAALRKHWTEEVFKKACKRSPGRDAFKQAVDQCVSDGAAWVKCVLTQDLWDAVYAIDLMDYIDNLSGDMRVDDWERDSEDAKKKSGPPFTISCPDVLSVYPVWYGDELGEVLEVQQRPLHQTFRQYRLTKSESGEIVTQEVGQAAATRPTQIWSAVPITVLEHWDQVYVTYAVQDGMKSGKATNGEKKANGRIVKQWKHGYGGRVPYFPAMGLMMGHYNNRKVGWGVAETKRWLVEYRSFLWSLHAQVCARDAMNPLFRELPEGSAPLNGNDGQPKAKETWMPGEIINGRPGEKLVPIEFPDVAESLQEQIKLVSVAIDQLTTPRVSSNIGDGVEGAGFAMSQQLSEARLRLDPFAQSIEDAWTEMTLFVWWMVREKIGETVYVYATGVNGGYLGAGPDDLKSNVGIHWRLDPEQPSAKLIESRYWNERIAAGTASKDQAITAMGDSPSEVRLGQTLERMRQSPWYQRYQDQTTLQKLGKGDVMAEAAAAQHIVETGQLPSGQPPVSVPGGQPFAAPPAMGNGQVPDMGQLATAPNGGPAPEPMPGGNPVGSTPGAVVPSRSVAPTVQGLGG